MQIRVQLHSLPTGQGIDLASEFEPPWSPYSKDGVSGDLREWVGGSDLGRVPRRGAYQLHIGDLSTRFVGWDVPSHRQLVSLKPPWGLPCSS